MKVTLTVNGSHHTFDGVRGHESLLHLLRERCGLTGTKNACEQGECGSCSVQVDGVLAFACLVSAAQTDGCRVRTVEGMAEHAGPGALHPIAQAFLDAGAVQCGFCSPGLLMATEDLLRRRPDPSDDEIREALSGNLCRCTGYASVLDAVRLAAGRTTTNARS